MRRFDHEAVPREQFREMRRRVEANAMLAFAVRMPAPPRRTHGQHPGQRVERPFMTDHGVIISEPPIPGEKPAHHAVAISAVPHQHATRLEDARPLGHDTLIVARKEKEAERGEKVDHCVEPRGPSCRKPSHVTARVPQCLRGPPCLRAGQQLAREIEPVNVVPGFGEEMRMPSLATRDVEDTRAGGQPENFE